MMSKIRESKIYIPAMWMLLFILFSVVFSINSRFLPKEGPIIEPTLESGATIFKSIYSMQKEYSK